MLRTSDQQFGFKRGHSCADCSFALKTTIDHYMERGNTNMFVCTLGLSKAYDRVPYYRLFSKLLDIGAPVYFVRMLSVWYDQQRMHVKWKEKLSDVFKMSNGVRQGSVLSPGLFNVYMNDMIEKLQSSGYGARIGHLYVGCLAYADDISLLSPTRYGMQRMLDTCSVFAEENGLVFNSRKSICTVFVKNRRLRLVDPKVSLNETVLPFKTFINHLGVVMDSFRQS